MRLVEVKAIPIDTLEKYKDWTGEELKMHLKNLPSEFARLKKRVEYLNDVAHDLLMAVEPRRLELTRRRAYGEGNDGEGNAGTYADVPHEHVMTPEEKEQFLSTMADLEETGEKLKAAKILMRDLKAVKTARTKGAPAIPRPPAIPNKVPVGPGRTIENPYNKGDKQFAGDPASFPFSKTQANLYHALTTIFARSGRKLTHMYAARAGHSGYTFVVYSDDAPFAWYKYATASSPQAGQNYIFFNGVRLNTSDFIALTDSEQDRWMAMLT